MTFFGYNFLFLDQNVLSLAVQLVWDMKYLNFVNVSIL